MKTSYRLLAAVMFMTLPIISLQAQEKLQHLVIHEDYVLPSQMPKYEEASKNLVKALRENAITDAKFWAFWQDDNTYVYATPVENFAALDQSMWKSLEDKIGKGNSETLFKAFDETYQSHRTFMVNYHPDLSYKADQLSNGNSNYRVWTFVFLSRKPRCCDENFQRVEADVRIKKCALRIHGLFQWIWYGRPGISSARFGV